MPVRVARDSTTGLHHVVDGEGASLERVNRFLSTLSVRGLSPDTVRSYAFDLVAIYRWLKRANKRLLELQESDLIDFVAEQRNMGAKPRSINRRLNTCRLIYRFWTDKELKRGRAVSLPPPSVRGPGRGVLGLHQRKKPHRLPLRVKVPQTLVEPLTATQVRFLLGRFRRYRDRTIVYLMLLCGLRSREILLAKLSDVDFEERRIRIHGKGDKERVLPLPDVTAENMNKYLRLERPLACPSEELFVVLQGKRRGHPMTRSGLRSLFRHHRKQDDIVNANPHRLRHTFGTDMARAGVRLPVLQKMMGHVYCTTTLQYINLSMADIADEYRRAITDIEQRYQRPDSE